MKTIFYYFSGTGNTLKICNLLADELQKLGFNCDLYEISAQNTRETPAPSDYDRVILAYPVHGFNAPETVLKFAANLPEAHGKSVYIVKTSGEPLKLNSASSLDLCGILSNKNYIVYGEYHYIMPYNIIFRHSDGMASRMRRAALNAAPGDAEEIALNVRKELEFKRRYTAVSKTFKIEHSAIKKIGKGFSADEDKCLHCNKCKNNCPAKNIGVVNGKIVFGNACAGCMRCAFECPVDAIDTGLLNGWKVNGAYSFELLDDEGEICSYCKKAYEDYFGAHSALQNKVACDKIEERKLCKEKF